MKVTVDRDGVCAGDDVSHERLVEVGSPESLEAFVRAVIWAYPLPIIAGAEATWCLSADFPLAVVAQQWTEPRFLPGLQVASLCRPFPAEGAKLRFSYFAQTDPNVVANVLGRLHLNWW